MNADSMASGWYYLKRGAPTEQRVGPLSWQQLWTLAQSGTVGPDDLVWNQQFPVWVSAEQVPGLLAASAQTGGGAATGAAQQGGGATSSARQGGGATATAQGVAGRSRLLTVGLPIVALIVVAGVLIAYFGFLRDSGGTPTDGTGTTITGSTLADSTADGSTADGVTTTAADGITVTTATSTTSTGEMGSTTTATGGEASTTSTMGGTTSTTEGSAPNTWTKLSPGGGLPLSRERAAWVYDPQTHRAILFGGWHGGCLGETWAYDPVADTWANLIPSGAVPSERTGHTMVYIPDTGRMILFGGRSGTTDLNDTWAYDPVANVWTKLDPSGELPSPRYFHTMVYDPVKGKAILFGGMSGAALDDIWAYDPAGNSWKELRPARARPPARSGHCMVYDSDTGKAILFGGASGDTLLNDTWLYTPGANIWNELDPGGGLPPARGAASMAYDPGTSKVILFGGGIKGVDGGDFNDIWAYDPAANTWTDLKPAGEVPTIRWGSSIISDPASGKLFLFGGMGEFTYYDQTWAYTPQL